MSLKAKLEAVIYAAEEPITLAQLALLFTAEALELKAEQEAASAAAQPEESPAVDEPLPLIEDATNPAEPEAEAANEAAAEAGPQEAADAEAGAEPAAEASGETAPAGETATEGGAESGEPASAEAPEAAEVGESELKRQARQRDRDVRNVLRQLLDELIAECAADDRGVEIREVAGGYRMATKPECHDAVRGFVKSLKPPLKLSLPALETLAVIAYKQPVTAPEVNEIRGVDSSGVFGSLLSRKLIATAGRKQVVGRPILYKTTREFLLRFGLKDVTELPSMEEFEKLAASELEEPESAEEEPGAEADGERGAELDQKAGEESEESAETSNDTNEPAAAAEETDAEKPAAEEVAGEEQSVEQPAPEEETAAEPAAEEPAAEVAAEEEPAADEPVKTEPVAEEQAAEEPASPGPAEEPAETEKIPHD